MGTPLRPPAVIRGPAPAPPGPPKALPTFMSS
jgi:hypothetical protein